MFSRVLWQTIAMHTYPNTKEEIVIDNLHGQNIEDPYRWLEDVQNPEVQQWLDEQNEYTRSFLDNLPRRKELRGQFESLFREETLEMPSPRKGKYFFMKRKADEDLSSLYVKEGLSGTPRILVDTNQISKEKGFPVNLAGFSISKDAKFITYCLSDSANDKNNQYVMNVETGEKLEDVVPGDLYPGTGSWNLDNTGFWYVRRLAEIPTGEEKFHKKVFYHKLGTHFSEDKIVFGEDMPKEDVPSVISSSDGKYLLLSRHVASEKTRRTEVYLWELFSPDKGLVPVVTSISDNATSVYFWATISGEYIYIHTNYKAPMWKIERVHISNIEKGMDAWETVIAEKSDVLIEDFSISKNKLFVVTLQNVHSVLSEYSRSGELQKIIDLPTLGTCGGVSLEYEGDEGFFVFSSFAYPPTVFRIDFNTGGISIHDQQKIAVDIENISSSQVWYDSKDGTKVPMFLMHKKDLQLSGKNPTVLYGYGGFNIKMVPAFMKVIMPFIEAGGVFVIANLRGGGEFGSAWHTAGTKKQKQNTFNDFIAAAEWLIHNNYTNSNQLAISGGSNGGLLVGAVMTQRPELVKTVLMSVPVVDMLRYHLFHGGRHWISDWGSPEDPEMFPYLLAYSPYHNVKEGVSYPATLILTSDEDDRVHPGQAFKMAARLQKDNSSNNPILLRVQRKAGHSGAVDISRYIDRAVDEWSFVFDQLGVFK